MHLKLLTTSEKLFDGDIEAVVLPGSAGQMTILPHHANMLAGLATGKVTVRVSGAEQHFSVSGGIVDINRNQVTALVQSPP